MRIVVLLIMTALTAACATGHPPVTERSTMLPTRAIDRVPHEQLEVPTPTDEYILAAHHADPDCSITKSLYTKTWHKDEYVSEYTTIKHRDTLTCELWNPSFFNDYEGEGIHPDRIIRAALINGRGYHVVSYNERTRTFIVSN